MGDIGPDGDVRATGGIEIGDVWSFAVGTPAAKIHARLRAGADVAGAGESLCNGRIVVSHALSVDRIVNPVSDVRIVEVRRAIDIDVVGSPVEAAAPTISAPPPVPKRIGPTEGQPGRKEVGAYVIRRPEIIGRVVGIGPRAVNDARLVIRH